MMLNIVAAREGFKDITISDICFVRSEVYIADDHTKRMNQREPQQFHKDGRLYIRPEQYIIRNEDY